MSLDQLQRIRARRLEKQLSEVQIQKSALQTAEAQLAQAHQNLEQFHHNRLQMQENMFQHMLGQASNPQALFDYRDKLDRLLIQEEQLKAAIPVAQQQVEAAKQNFLAAKQVANQLAMKNEKTKEIIEIQAKAALKQAIKVQEFLQEP